MKIVESVVTGNTGMIENVFRALCILDTMGGQAGQWGMRLKDT